MKLEEMKAIAGARTGGKWPEYEDAIAFLIDRAPYNVKFIALAANTYSKLIAVAEAAKAKKDQKIFDEEEDNRLGLALDDALEALEQ